MMMSKKEMSHSHLMLLFAGESSCVSVVFSTSTKVTLSVNSNASSEDVEKNLGLCSFFASSFFLQNRYDHSHTLA